MKLMVASYNNGATDWNAEAEETAFRSYELSQGFNEPAKCNILLGDPTGAILRKYNADANDVYIGAGKVTIEDPDTPVDVFYGRIIKVVGDSAERTVKLECRDWLDQLDDEVITYDMREPLNAAGLRQSDISSDVDGACTPVIYPAYSNLKGAVSIDGAVETDDTTDANDAGANDMELLPAIPVTGDAYCFGFDHQAKGIRVNIGTAGVDGGGGVYTITWKYSQGADAWANLAGVTDGTNGFHNAGVCEVTYTVPVDWATDEVGGITAYWVKAVSTIGEIGTIPVGTQAWSYSYGLSDDDIDNFDVDEWNGKYLMFPAESSGTQVITTGPYARTMLNGTEDAGDHTDVWLDDANFHDTHAAAGGAILIQYDCHINAELGSLYVSGPSAGYIDLTCICYNDTQPASLTVYIRNAAETLRLIHTQVIDTTTTNKITMRITIPKSYLTGFIDTLGEATILVGTTGIAATNVYLDVYQCLLSLTYAMSGTSTSYPIVDTTTNTIFTDVDLTITGVGAWECMKYCVAKEIYLHLEANTGPILAPNPTLGGSGVIDLTCAVGNVENTTGVSTRQYKNRTRLQILQDLATQDGAVFFIALGGSTVTYQKTFGADTATLTDSVVDNWQSLFDYSTMSNDALVYGARLGTYEVFQQSQHAASIAKYRATKSTVITSTGITSDIDAKAIADNLVAKDNDILQMVQCTISGFDTTHRLSTVVEITSSYLWSTAAKDYVVVRWAYDSKAHKSYLTLHPVSSIGFMPILTADVESTNIKRSTAKAEVDKYVPLPVSNEVL